MHKSVSVANYIVSLANAANDSVTPMQLMKLVYLSHGWMLGLCGKQLVSEPIEAWLYGPVIPELYQAIKHYKSSAVTSIPNTNNNEIFGEDEKNLIGQVYSIYGKYPGPTLSAFTHVEGSPWYITWHNAGKNAIISNDLIEQYYKQLGQNRTALMINLHIPNIPPPSPDDKATQESLHFANGDLDKIKGQTENDTHKFVHKWCIRIVLGVGTASILAFTIFLLVMLAYLVYSYVQYVVGNKPDTEGVKLGIEVLLGHIWKIASGSSFLVLLAQILLIGIKKNLKF